MLAYVLSELQWKDRIINYQHIFNESTLYILSVMMLMFTNYLSPEMRYIMGFMLIFFVFIFVIYNTIIMLLFSCKILILIVRKQYYKLKSKNLKHEIRQIIGHIQVNMDKNQDKSWF